MSHALNDKFERKFYCEAYPWQLDLASLYRQCLALNAMPSFSHSISNDISSLPRLKTWRTTPWDVSCL